MTKLSLVEKYSQRFDISTLIICMQISFQKAVHNCLGKTYASITRALTPAFVAVQIDKFCVALLHPTFCTR